MERPGLRRLTSGSKLKNTPQFHRPKSVHSAHGGFDSRLDAWLLALHCLPAKMALIASSTVHYPWIVPRLDKKRIRLPKHWIQMIQCSLKFFTTFEIDPSSCHNFRGRLESRLHMQKYAKIKDGVSVA
jgi:hypothetical protein